MSNTNLEKGLFMTPENYKSKFTFNDKDLALDIYNAYTTSGNSRIAGGKITIAIKKYKVHLMITMIRKIMNEQNLDITPRVALRLQERLFNRNVAYPTLISEFAEKGRTASNKSDVFDKIDELVDMYGNEARSEMINIEAKIKEIKAREKKRSKDLALFDLA
ncbi:hypothetical protein [Vibrio lentus]|uniref:hypothetical protein n=1 Tax=Vibrio sp. R78045 TaxID=3093868 RepID=UPI0035536C4C